MLIGWEMRLINEPAPSACDVCTQQCEPEHIATFIGAMKQSDLCLRCANTAADLIKEARRPARRAHIVTEGKLSVEVA